MKEKTASYETGGRPRRGTPVFARGRGAFIAALTAAL